MHWYKHFTSYRNTPAMKMIFRVMGLEGVAVAYRLLEVGAENCTEANGFSSRMVLEPPMTKAMLAQELLTEIPDDYGVRFPGEKDIEPYLDLFDTAGLIMRGKETMPGSTMKDGKRVPSPVTFETISFVGLEDLIDDYTARCLRKKEMREEKAAKRSDKVRT